MRVEDRVLWVIRRVCAERKEYKILKLGGVYIVKTTYIEINFLPCVFDHLGFFVFGE